MSKKSVWRAFVLSLVVASILLTLVGGSFSLRGSMAGPYFAARTGEQASLDSEFAWSPSGIPVRRLPGHVIQCTGGSGGGSCGV